MMIEAGMVKRGMVIRIPSHPLYGTFKVSKYRWHFGQGVEFFTLHGVPTLIIPFKQEIEVIK